jgi:sugar O-acyltransferase (sialic acid O-acetyltransferase NeuD family)
LARLVIFGAGDVARLAHVYFKTDSPHDVHAFVVDAAYKEADTFDGLPLCAFEELARRYPPSGYEAFVAIGYARMNRVRRAKYDAMRAAGYRFVSYLSSRCTYLSSSQPGDNCFILEDNTVQPFVTIGNNVTLWSGNHIGHDSVIEDHCFITSHVVVSGHVRVGAGSFIGVNATLRDAITIGPETLIAAGSVIMKNTAPRGVYFPERAKRLPKSSDEIEL